MFPFYSLLSCWAQVSEALYLHYTVESSRLHLSVSIDVVIHMDSDGLSPIRAWEFQSEP